ncbi:MAG TPA: phosphotransferase [Gaiellaceae bacterium]|nr:phosphotransferase [Gaiellaceae bacterium]
MRVWDAEVTIDEPLVRRLIAEPEVESLSLLSEGWDRSVWLVNGKLVFAFPRRAAVVEPLEREIALLPRLARLLPLPITEPSIVGRPSEAYPWPFFGAEFLPGRELCDVDPEMPRMQIGVDAASFLRRLHSAEIATAVDAPALPVDPTGRSDMAQRVPTTRDYLTRVDWNVPKHVARMLDEAERLPSQGEPTTVVHGDLHFRHLLVNEGRLSGVIDWVDLCRADPCVDLQLVWSVLEPDDRAAFLDAYGPVSNEQLLRARVLALSLSAALAWYGRENGMANVEREALAGLDRTSR